MKAFPRGGMQAVALYELLVEAMERQINWPELIAAAGVRASRLGVAAMIGRREDEAKVAGGVGSALAGR